MKTGIRGKAAERLQERKGNVKEIAGKQGDNPKLETEHGGEEASGVVQERYGPFKRFMEN